jgi:hypothetical protein
MKRYLFFIILLMPAFLHAQELYVSTEPASNMAANSFGFRVTNRFFKMEHEGVTGMRIEPELMWGISKKLMVHVVGLASNQMQPSLRFEGGSVYAKYRFLSNDDVQSHFRMAAYVKGSVIDNPFVPVMREGAVKPYDNQELDLEGGASGLSGGIIATQLIHKLAVSATVGYNRFLNNTKDNLPDYLSANAVNYSLSAGYLLLPRSYRSYDQTNLNIYVEFLGKANTDAVSRNQYLDVAPAIQLIFNSSTRLDFSYRTELFGDMSRNVFNTFTLRFEHNIFNISTKRK